MGIELTCPVCGGIVEIPEDALSGEVFEHDECGSQLELVIDDDGKMYLKELEDIGEDWGE